MNFKVGDIVEFKHKTNWKGQYKITKIDSTRFYKDRIWCYFPETERELYSSPNQLIKVKSYYEGKLISKTKLI